VTNNDQTKTTCPVLEREAKAASANAGERLRQVRPEMVILR
jgi:hypothetical protein